MNEDQPSLPNLSNVLPGANNLVARHHIVAVTRRSARLVSPLRTIENLSEPDVTL